MGFSQLVFTANGHRENFCFSSSASYPCYQRGTALADTFFLAVLLLLLFLRTLFYSKNAASDLTAYGEGTGFLPTFICLLITRLE